MTLGDLRESDAQFLSRKFVFNISEFTQRHLLILSDPT